jgi:hypothetical protein
MEHTRIPLQAYKYQPSGKRDIDRPRRRWGGTTILQAGTGDCPNPWSDDDDCVVSYVCKVCNFLRNVRKEGWLVLCRTSCNKFRRIAPRSSPYAMHSIWVNNVNDFSLEFRHKNENLTNRCQLRFVTTVMCSLSRLSQFNIILFEIKCFVCWCVLVTYRMF